MPAKTPAVADQSAAGELQQLRDDVARLRALVGPSEESYVKLRLDVLGARDAAIGAEAELGRLKGYCKALEVQSVRMERDHLWLRAQVIMRLKRLRPRVPSLSSVIDRLSR